jgi:hypothetical protein
MDVMCSKLTDRRSERHKQFSLGNLARKENEGGGGASRISNVFFLFLLHTLPQGN